MLTPELAEAIRCFSAPDAMDKLASDQGLFDLSEAALGKAVAGQISLEEALIVSGLAPRFSPGM